MKLPITETLQKYDDEYLGGNNDSIIEEIEDMEKKIRQEAVEEFRKGLLEEIRKIERKEWNRANQNPENIIAESRWCGMSEIIEKAESYNLPIK